ncbi:glutathione S-transferase family protein [Pendulispora brunnea]|uniref:Glutathione S-transferase family protein n=1 Tax=Pendulispora brunnea TaxID=2905690 RepID=A0ABZ2JZB7_9BACT
MDFYTNPLSPNCRKVDAVAKQLGIDLNVKLIDIRKGENREPAYLAINPNGKIPTLVDGDLTLWESNAIQCYIASKKDNDLWPKSNLRYDIMKWQAWELAHFGAAGRGLIFQRIVKQILNIGPADEARCAEDEANFKRFGAVLDNALKGKRFVCGDQLTLADFCLASTLTFAEHAKFPVADFANIRRWVASLDEQPGWRASKPPPM